jgi:hypothetical protein
VGLDAGVGIFGEGLGVEFFDDEVHFEGEGVQERVYLGLGRACSA